MDRNQTRLRELIHPASKWPAKGLILTSPIGCKARLMKAEAVTAHGDQPAFHGHDAENPALQIHGIRLTDDGINACPNITRLHQSLTSGQPITPQPAIKECTDCHPGHLPAACEQLLFPRNMVKITTKGRKRPD